jgi:hypothetical protein
MRPLRTGSRGRFHVDRLPFRFAISLLSNERMTAVPKGRAIRGSILPELSSPVRICSGLLFFCEATIRRRFDQTSDLRITSRKRIAKESACVASGIRQ